MVLCGKIDGYDHDHNKMESEMLSYRQGATEVRDQLVEQLQKKLDKIGSENCSRRKQLNYWIRRILGVNSEKAKFIPEERTTLYDSLCANDLLTPKSIDYVRREFERVKTENAFLSNFGLAAFQIIYGVEELIKELGLTGADKIAYRKENAAIAWQSLLAWCVITVNDVPQKSQMHKACNYVIRHYDELTAYLADDLYMQR